MQDVTNQKIALSDDRFRDGVISFSREELAPYFMPYHICTVDEFLTKLESNVPSFQNSVSFLEG